MPQGKTTDAVMRAFVKPRTEATKSFRGANISCQRIRTEAGSSRRPRSSSAMRGPASSLHCVDVIDAVERRFKDSGTDPSVWFDEFSVSQHKSGSRTFDWWQSTFLNAVGSMNHVLMAKLLP